MYIKCQVTDSHTLVPLLEDGAQLKANAGDIVEIKLKYARNNKFHRKYHSLIDFAYAYTSQAFLNAKCIESKEQFIDYIKLRAGLVEEVRFADCQCVKPLSVAFDSISETMFTTIYGKMAAYIIDHIFEPWRDAVKDYIRKNFL